MKEQDKSYIPLQVVGDFKPAGNSMTLWSPSEGILLMLEQRTILESSSVANSCGGTTGNWGFWLSFSRISTALTVLTDAASVTTLFDDDDSGKSTDF